MSLKARIARLESASWASGDSLALTDRALASAAGSQWLLTCTDAELEAIAGGVENSDLAEFKRIMEASIART